jgi:tetratricopeptide (TPR) repeat protein
MRSFKLLSLTMVALSVLVLASGAAWADEPKDRDGKVVSQFIDHLEELKSIPEVQRAKAKSLLEGEGETATAITDALIALYPEYAEGIRSSDEEDINRGVTLLEPLTGSSDAFLAADSSFYLARMLMNQERFEPAIPLLKKLVSDYARFTCHSGESIYFLGVAQAGLLDRQSAIGSFEKFLAENPQAAERLRVSAWRNVQELKAIEDGQLSDVKLHMDYSRRRLDQLETGEQTQEKQDRIVSMLAKLIKEEEKKDCNSSCKNSSKKKPSDSENAQAPKDSQEPKPGESQEGGSSSNANGEAVQKSYDDSPASPWSRLRDRSRDPANNAIKEKLPARYRDIVEKYYEAANGTTPQKDDN